MSEPSFEETRNRWSKNNHDIGWKILKENRDRITYAGKYQDRYKDAFLPKPAEMTSKSFNPSSLKASPSPSASPSFPRKIPRATKKCCAKEVETTSYRNATSDLNNSKHVALLAKYKPKPAKLELQDLDFTEINYLTVPNNAALCSTTPATQEPPNSFDTLKMLQEIETCIKASEQKQNYHDNISKFDELLKKRVLNPATLPAGELIREKSENFDVASQNEHQGQLKSFGEVQNFLRPGVSNLEAEKIADSRHSSVEKRAEKKSHSVARTVSDIQDRYRKIISRQLPHPRKSKIKVFYLSVRLFFKFSRIRRTWRIRLGGNARNLLENAAAIK